MVDKQGIFKVTVGLILWENFSFYQGGDRWNFTIHMAKKLNFQVALIVKT